MKTSHSSYHSRSSQVPVHASELSSRLWSIADALRGSMDASKFKDYILAMIFYRYLSGRAEKELLSGLCPGCRDTYEERFRKDPEAARKWSLEHLGWVIEPPFLFSSLIRQIENGLFSVRNLEEAIKAVANSAKSPEARAAFDGIFDSMNLNDPELGRDESQRSSLIAAVLSQIHSIPFDTEDTDIDVLGTAYMILIGQFASDAGKRGGEFFTPSAFSRLCARLACLGQEEISSVCDPAMGSASMLLEVLREIPPGSSVRFFGQEKNRTTYNLARMNMIIHGIPFGNFSFFHDDTIACDRFGSLKFTVQVANPPFSQKWNSDPEYLKDPRFSGAGRLAPRSYEDFAFLQHMVYHMDDNGRAAVLLPHGILFRGGAEGVIRTHMVKNLNVVDAVIGLPPGCFHGTPIPVCCLVLARNRSCPDSVLFIDASRSFLPGRKINTISDEDIDRIVTVCRDRTEQNGFSRSVPLSLIEENEFSLNISRYVSAAEEEPPVDLKQVREELAFHRAQCARLQQEMDRYLSRLGL